AARVASSTSASLARPRPRPRPGGRSNAGYAHPSTATSSKINTQLLDIQRRYVVSTYSAITRLLHDPRTSSDERKSARGAGALAASGRLAPPGEPGSAPFMFLAPREPASPPFILLDPPEHDRLRRLVMQQFTPDRVRGMHRRIGELVDGLLDTQAGGGELDVVDALAYPLPVTVICELLGVPHEDEPRFHDWASALARSLDPAERIPEPEIHAAGQAALQLLGYLAQLVEVRRTQPGDDLLS